MRKLPNERLDKGCRQGLCQFHCNIVTVCNINCSIATCVLNVCRAYLYIQNNMHANMHSRLARPQYQVYLPVLYSVFSLKKIKRKKQKEKRGNGFMSRLGTHQAN